MAYFQNKLTNQTADDEKLLFKRVRISVNIVYRNEHISKSIAKHMLMQKGIVECKANPITGRVLVIFNEFLVNEEIIEQHVKTFVQLQRNSAQRNIIKQINQKNEMETALPISIEEIDPAINADENKLWHNMHYSSAETVLGTNIKSGLSHKDVTERTTEFGFNILSEKKKKSLFSSFVDNLGNFSTKLLLGVSAASLLIGNIVDAAAILGIVFLETALSTVQQSKAENSIYSLKNMMVHKAKVIRNGNEMEIDAKHLVPGDLILLEAGEKVPADARIIECTDLKTSEASLTGESIPISKSPEVCEKQANLGDRFNMLYMGTSILLGKCKALVVATGMNTEIGKIAAILQNINIELTPLQRRMMRFTRGLTKLCISLCLAAGAFGLIMGRSLVEILTMGISFSIGAMPESLPAVVTVAMAVSVQRMSKRKTITRKLPSVESLGSANVICCDKTGTLTMNEMTVRKIYVDNSYYKVSGTGYEPKGNITLTKGFSQTSEDSLKKLLTYGVLCNNACLIKGKEDKWVIKGDPTEGALLTAVKKYKIDETYIKENFNRLKEIPFDSSTRYMTVVVDTPNGKIAICKGALSSVIKNCTTIYEDGENKLLTSSHKDKLSKICEYMGNEALRVLAFSFRKLGSSSVKNIENNHVFLGMIAMEDPPKDGVKEAIKKCHNAGIKVVMITGDNKNTAAAIGRELGILTKGSVLSGSDLENLSDSELASKITEVQVFARTSPEQKLRIVKAFKRAGDVVAMTGDGVNDAPAIKEANIGIAMGSNGSDVANDAASIVLADGNFCTIVSAIEEGRAVSNNIKTTCKYLLSGSLGEMLAIFLSSAVTGSLPLLSMQILWVNVICETLLGSPLAVEPPGENIMNTSPLKKDAPIMDKELGKSVIRRGAGIGLTTFAAYEIPLLLGYGIAKARTLAFSNLVLTQIINCYDSRGNRNRPASKFMLKILFTSAALLAGIIYIPFMGSLLSTVPLGVKDWALLSGLTALSRI
ncbi:MAG: HAD-IC family P-type ATPase [Bacillota bacterium]|nr:HAD-IC family P-type ATPase [Bacillota bacterium]